MTGSLSEPEIRHLVQTRDFAALEEGSTRLSREPIERYQWPLAAALAASGWFLRNKAATSSQSDD